MVREIAYIRIKSGAQEAFERAVAQAEAIFRSAPGCRGLTLERSIEEPCRYLLVVGWTTVDAHMVDFRHSAGYGQWRMLAAPHFAEPPVVEHIRTVFASE